MKTSFLLAIFPLLLSVLPAGAGGSGCNYVREVVPGRAFAAGTPLESLLADSLSAVTVSYFDGIGRKVLEVRRGAGGAGSDVGFLSEYDLAGTVPAIAAGDYHNPVDYDAAGRPVRDDTRDIVRIKYHSFGDFVSRVDYGSGNRLTMTYEPDGRLTARRYDRYRTTLTPRVGANGDTTWRAVKKLESSDIFSYSGPFETHNGRTTVQTGFGHWDYADSAHVWYARDIKGSVRNTVQLSASGGRQSANHVFTYPSGLPVRVVGAWRTDRLHQGKEWMEADGTGWYDNAARLYDAILIRFLTPDPLWREFGTTSPYNYCLANPMRFLDRDGMKPTPAEAALMASLVYGRNLLNDNLPEGLNGWKISSVETSIKMNRNKWYENGLQSALFEKNYEDGKVEYVYVFAGSNSPTDFAEDFFQVFGGSDQYSKAIRNARTLSAEIGENELTFVGHSLGGGEAAAGSMATGRDAITFNPAAVSLFTKIVHNLNFKGNIDNYIIEGSKSNNTAGDFVTWIQGELGLQADGNRYPVPSSVESKIDAHGIINFVNHFSAER